MRYADSRCEIIESSQPEHTYTFVGPCVVTGKEQRVTVKAQDLFRYRQGGYVQDCFPYLNKGDREFLISGTSDEGWQQLFGNPDEEPEEESDE
jgi:hypothetical protein